MKKKRLQAARNAVGFNKKAKTSRTKETGMIGTASGVKRFWDAVGKAEPQVWGLDHEDVLENEFFVVKRFRQGSNYTARFVNPPMAGHHSNIAQRAVKFYLDETEDSVYAVEWKPATRETRNYGIDEIVEHVGMAMDVIADGGHDEIHMAGLCQGGWAQAMWAALNPDRVASLTIAGSPIDFKAGGGKLQMRLGFVTDAWIDWTICMNGGVWPGQAQLTGFKMLNPVDRYAGTYFDLMDAVNAGDDKAVDKWVRNNSWYEYVQDLPGRMIREVVRKLFRDNQLVKGRLEVLGETVDLSRIDCPVAAITGDDDDITLEPQCAAILDHVSSERKAHYAIPKTGHIGIFLKNASMEKWLEALNFVSNSPK